MRSAYRPILKEALKIAWKNPWLWFLGLFATALVGGGEFNILFNNISVVQDQGIYLSDLRSVFAQGSIGAWVATIFEVLKNLNTVSVIVLLLVLIVAFFLLWLAVVCEGGLVSGAFRAYRGEATSFAESWRRGVSKFWPVLWLNISGRVAIYIVLVLLGLPFFFLYVSTNSLTWQWVLLLISFLVFVPFAIVVAFLIKYAVISVVVKNNDFKMAVKEAWRLFSKNWIVSIEMALILFLINIIFGLGIMLVLLVLATPFVIVGFVFYSLAIAPVLWVIIVLGLIVLALGLFTLGAFFTTFRTTVWVLLATRLNEGVILPKVLRVAALMMKKKS